MRGSLLKFFFATSLMGLSFLYGQEGGAIGQEDTVYGMLGEVVEYTIPKSLYGKDENFTIEEMDKKFLRDLTRPQDFQKDKKYRFLTLSVGETRVVIDKIDTSGGKMGFLVLHIIIREAPKPVEATKKEDMPGAEKPQALELEKIKPTEGGSSKKSSGPMSESDEAMKSSDKTIKSTNTVFNHLVEGFKNKRYEIERESFVRGLDGFIKDGNGSSKEVMQLKLIKARVLEDISKKKESEAVLKELADEDLLPAEEQDPEVKDLRRQVFYDLYLSNLEKDKEKEAKNYLEKVIAITEETSPYYSYFLYKMGNLNKKEKDYDAAYAQLKYVYQLMTGMQDIHVSSGDEKNMGEIYMFKGKRFEDLKPEEKEELLAIFHGDKSFMDKVFFDLAEVYEASKKNRDYDKAKKLYEDLLKNFPESELAKLAKMKIFYLDNNFIKPR